MAISAQQKIKVAVIGGGPGGYVAAIRAAQLGAEVTLIEKNKLGGTCLNVGCIPTKSLLHAAEIVQEIQHSAKEYGVDITLNKIDWQHVQAKKTEIVGNLVSGVMGLMRANKIKVITAQASVLDEYHVLLKFNDGSVDKLNFDRLIIASGSVASKPPIPGLENNEHCIDSTGALSLATIPASLLIIGGGVIGIEMAGIYAAFGTQVTVVEALPSLLPMLDSDTVTLLQNQLKQQGVVIHTEAKVVNITTRGAHACSTLTMQGKTQEILTEKVLYAVGRKTDTAALGLDNVGIKTEQGRIQVNALMQTTLPHIYAIGDCLGEIMLAHVASQQGEVAAENALGQSAQYAPKAIPSCVYTLPELAGVGLTEQACQQQNLAYKVGKFPLSANGKALIMNNGQGLVKVILDKKYQSILGVHIFGPRATDLIAEAALAIEMEATAEELIATIHAHPTVSEAIREGVLAAEGRAIHIPNKKSSTAA